MHPAHRFPMAGSFQNRSTLASARFFRPAVLPRPSPERTPERSFASRDSRFATTAARRTTRGCRNPGPHGLDSHRKPPQRSKISSSAGPGTRPSPHLPRARSACRHIAFPLILQIPPPRRRLALPLSEPEPGELWGFGASGSIPLRIFSAFHAVFSTLPWATLPKSRRQSPRNIDLRRRDQQNCCISVVPGLTSKPAGHRSTSRRAQPRPSSILSGIRFHLLA